MALTAVSKLGSPVTSTTGTSRSTARIALRNCTPPRFGIEMSLTITSYAPAEKPSNAFQPSAAVSTSMPSRRRSRVKSRRTSGSSSTTNTRPSELSSAFMAHELADQRAQREDVERLLHSRIRHGIEEVLRPCRERPARHEHEALGLVGQLPRHPLVQIDARHLRHQHVAEHDVESRAALQ